jgi:hypothetical protein
MADGARLLNRRHHGDSPSGASTSPRIESFRVNAVVIGDENPRHGTEDHSSSMFLVPGSRFVFGVPVLGQGSRFRVQRFRVQGSVPRSRFLSIFAVAERRTWNTEPEP